MVYSEEDAFKIAYNYVRNPNYPATYLPQEVRDKIKILQSEGLESWDQVSKKISEYNNAKKLQEEQKKEFYQEVYNKPEYSGGFSSKGGENERLKMSVAPGYVNISKVGLPTKPQLQLYDDIQTPSIVEPVKKPEGFLEGLEFDLSSKRRVLRTEYERNGFNAIQQAKLFGYGFASDIIGNVIGIKQLPSLAKNIYRNPKMLLELPSKIKEQGKNFGLLLKDSPGEALGVVGGELLLLKGSGKALEWLGKLKEGTLARIGGKYLGKAKAGDIIRIPLKEGEAKLQVVNRIPKEELESQVNRAGRKFNAISSQADKLLSVIKNEKVLRKPIPNEQFFSRQTKKLLSKFDAGTISKMELLRLDDLIVNQGSKGILERSFFADPSGKIRPSRLGLTKENQGDFLDFLSGDVTFKKPKPQILFFEKAEIERFPRSLKSIAYKISKGLPLTNSERIKYLSFQQRLTGKFKPVGFVTKESEILLAPNEIIRRSKQLGNVIIEGRRVPIIKTEVVKVSPRLQRFINAYRRNLLTSKQITKLDNILKRITGFNYGLRGSYSLGKKYFNLRSLGGSILSKFNNNKKINLSVLSPRGYTYNKLFSNKKLSFYKKGNYSYYKSKAYTVPYVPKTGYPTSYKKNYRSYYNNKYPYPVPTKPRSKYFYNQYYKKYPPKYPPKYTSGSPIPTTNYDYPNKNNYRRYKNKTIKYENKIRRNEAYIIYLKRGKKFIKAKGKPLDFYSAKDRMAYLLDNTLARTGRLIRVKSRITGVITPKERGYFRRTKSNLRNFKIVRGKPYKLLNTYIERKGKPLLSTIGEKKEINIYRSRYGTRRNTRYRRITPRIRTRKK